VQEGFGLMGVETVDSPSDQGFLQRRRQRCGKLGEFAWSGGLQSDGPNRGFRIGGPLLEPLNRPGEAAVPGENPFLGRLRKIFGKTQAEVHSSPFLR
jgi:hypothetical protein